MNTCVISVVTVYSIEYHKSDYPSVRITIIIPRCVGDCHGNLCCTAGDICP